MPSCNRREFLTRAGLIRPQMISGEAKDLFVARAMGLPHPTALFHAEHDRPDIPTKARVAQAVRVPRQKSDPWPRVNVAHFAVLAWVIVSAIAIVVLS